MDKKQFRTEFDALLKIARLHHWCTQVEDKIQELIENKEQKNNRDIEKILFKKVESKKLQREEIIIIIILLFFLTDKHTNLIEIFYNTIKNQIYANDFNFLFKH